MQVDGDPSSDTPAKLAPTVVVGGGTWVPATGVPTGDTLAPGAAFSQGTAVAAPAEDVTTGPAPNDSEAGMVAAVVGEHVTKIIQKLMHLLNVEWWNRKGTASWSKARFD